jgi:ABC-type transporter Mla MlaB component
METEALVSLAQSLSKAQKSTSRIDFDLSKVKAVDCCTMVNLMDTVHGEEQWHWQEVWF